MDAAVLPSGGAASTITASLTGRASARSARIRAPSKNSCHAAVPAKFPGTASTCSNPSRSSRTSAFPPTENATSAQVPPASMPIAAPDALGSTGSPCGSSI
jgi:hypothetical protein